MDDNKFGFITTPYRLDRKLYKYYANIDHAIKNLKEKCIHLDPVYTFNDPFEALFLKSKYTQDVSIDKVYTVLENIFQYICDSNTLKKHYASEKVFKAIARFKLSGDVEFMETEYPIDECIKLIYNKLRGPSISFEEFCEVIEEGYLNSNPFTRIKCKMSCFSDVNDSILMWSYYANKHKGVCVEYDLSQLDLELPFNRKIYESIARVNYSRHRANAVNAFPLDDTYLNLLLTKADVWSHEHEWRLICETQEEYLPLACVSGIYLGVNFDINSDTYKELLEISNTYDSLKIHKMKLDTQEYKLNTEEIYDSSFYHAFQNFKENAGK